MATPEKRIVSAVLALAALLFPACGPDARPEGANVVFVVIDTLRSDRLSAYGAKKRLSRTLDAFAGDGFCFRRAHAPSTWTKPSVASLMTGLYPGRHGAVGSLMFLKNMTHLDKEFDTLAELFKGEGYRTAAFVTNPHIIPNYNFDQGFDEFVWPAGPACKLFNGAIEWVKQRRKDCGFFLYLHVVDPHSPYFPPQAFRRNYAAGDPGPTAPFTRRGEPMEILLWLEQYRKWQSSGGREPFRFDYDQDWMKDMIARKAPKLSVGELPEGGLDFEGPDDPELMKRIRYLISLYDAEVAYTDNAFKIFLSVLEEEGLLDETVVVVTSDHGEAFLEHNEWGHGHSVFEEETGVPLIFHVPRQEGGAFTGETSEHVSLVDLYPTVLDLVGIQVPDGLDGVSLWPVLKSGGAELPAGGPVFSETVLENGDHAAVMSGTNKLIRSESRDSGVVWSFFDLLKDPGEKHPLDPEKAGGPALGLKKSLDAFLRGRTLDLNKKGEAGEPSAEEIEQLMELGYM